MNKNNDLKVKEEPEEEQKSIVDESGQFIEAPSQDETSNSVINQNDEKEQQIQLQQQQLQPQQKNDIENLNNQKFSLEINKNLENNLENLKIPPKLTVEDEKEVDKEEEETIKDEDLMPMKDFLELLKTACQIHDIINFGESKFFGDPDLTKLANDPMIHNLLGEEFKQHITELAALYDTQLTASSTTPIGQSNTPASTNSLKKRSGGLGDSLRLSLNGKSISNSTSTTRSGYNRELPPALKKRLEDFVNQGIMDSVLPYLCSPNSPNLNNSDLGNPPSNPNNLEYSNSNGNVNNIIPINSGLFSNYEGNTNSTNSSGSSNNSTNNNNNNQTTNKFGTKVAAKLKEINANSNHSKPLTSCGNTESGSSSQCKSRIHTSVDLTESVIGKSGASDLTVASYSSSKTDAPDKHKPPKTADTVYKVKENKTTLRRKSLASGLGSRESHDNKKHGESEVVIHVCDEVKNTSKDFNCPQNLLVSKMKYFADVTGGQKLEDMDISVHCDIQIFEWLMKWVKKDLSQPGDGSNNSPQLDSSNVIPILVSASFLQMEPLLLDCLTFCHSRLNDVVRTSTNLSCLNDAIVTRLAAMFTNLELEMVKDKKDRVTPRLWTKLIQSIMEPEPQALRGHYFSLAGLYRCLKCGKYITQAAATYIYCVPSNIRVNRWGQLVSSHVRDPQWDINHYIQTLHKELKNWRKVYWKLWGHCHFLYCCICETHFPVYQMNWCMYHPEPAQFLGPITEGHAPGPAGRFPCCGQQAFRFETLVGPNGCQFREHSVLVETDRDRAVLALAQIASEGGCLTETPKIKPNNANGQITDPIWAGISLMPTKCRQGLLPSIQLDEPHPKFFRRGKQPISYPESSSDSDSSDSFPTARGKFSSSQYSGSTDGCESESSSERNYRSNRRRRPARTAKTYGRYWCGEVSARSNQDNQREFEEKIMKQIMSVVSKKNGNDLSSVHSQTLNGGIYVRLESEWKEQLRQRNINKAKAKT